MELFSSHKILISIRGLERTFSVGSLIFGSDQWFPMQASSKWFLQHVSIKFEGVFFCTNVSRKTWVCYELKFQDPSQFQRRTQWIILTKPSCAQPQWLVFLRVSTDVSHLWSPGPSNESTVEERLRGRFLSGFQTVISWNMERLSSGRGVV